MQFEVSEENPHCNNPFDEDYNPFAAYYWECFNGKYSEKNESDDEQAG